MNAKCAKSLGHTSFEPNMIMVTILPPGCPDVVIHLSGPDMPVIADD
jgi:hypothetical protein